MTNEAYRYTADTMTDEQFDEVGDLADTVVLEFIGRFSDPQMRGHATSLVLLSAINLLRHLDDDAAEWIDQLVEESFAEDEPWDVELAVAETLQ